MLQPSVFPKNKIKNQKGRGFTFAGRLEQLVGLGFGVLDVVGDEDVIEDAAAVDGPQLEPVGFKSRSMCVKRMVRPMQPAAPHVRPAGRGHGEANKIKTSIGLVEIYGRFTNPTNALSSYTPTLSE